MTSDFAGLRHIADECVALVSDNFELRLDWSVDSLAVLDGVCESLLADGPLGKDRLDLWWKLVGAYTGEVLVRVYGGEWVTDKEAQGRVAVSVRWMTAFPFNIALRVLEGEPYKSLASFARSVPAIAEHSRPTT